MTEMPPGTPIIQESLSHLKEFLAFLPELNKKSARGCVLISCSYIDDILLSILQSFLIEGEENARLTEGYNAPLGTFSTRISAAYALGLISEKEFKEANALRKIRNEFAHRVHTSFETQKVRDLCSNLTFAAQGYDDVTVDARSRYTTAAVASILALTNRPAYVARERRGEKVWPS